MRGRSGPRQWRSGKRPLVTTEREGVLPHVYCLRIDSKGDEGTHVLPLAIALVTIWEFLNFLQGKGR